MANWKRKDPKRVARAYRSSGVGKRSAGTAEGDGMGVEIVQASGESERGGLSEAGVSIGASAPASRAGGGPGMGVGKPGGAEGADSDEGGVGTGIRFISFRIESS